MERVVISRKTLESLVREVLEYWDYADTGLTSAEVRRVAIMLDEAIEVLGIQEQLHLESVERAQRDAEEWRKQQAAKESN
jgi:hypothetical protein